MKKFREYLSEEMQPFAHTEKGFVGVDNNAVRDNINLILANVTARSYATPYHAIEMVRKGLAPFHISLPATLFLDGEYGHEVFEINQFGEKSGVTDSGEVITTESSPYFLYFEYEMNDKGSFEIFSEVVNEDELNEIMSDMDSDDEDEEEELDEEVKKPTGELKDACWTGYTAVGFKMKNGKRVPNCVPVSEAQINEIGDTQAGRNALGSYIKKASHDVAAKSAAVRGFARDSEESRKKQDITNARKSDERSDKMFKKSWNRRQGIAKAVDRLTKEETSSKQQKAKTPQKANFNVAKNLARKAMKAQVAKTKTK